MTDCKTFTNPLLLEAGIKDIPLLSNGALAPVQVPVPGASRGMPSVALIGCWYGQDYIQLSAARTALEWTLQSNPCPKIYIVEAARPSDKRFFRETKGAICLERTIQPQSEGIWMKEALWSIGARQAIQDGCTKLVFIDLDCSFVHQDWAIKVSKALDQYDVISPHLAYYMAGQPDWRKLGIKISMGNAFSKGTGSGNPGISWGMTAAFFAGSLKAKIPNFLDSRGDVIFWLTCQDFEKAFPVYQSLTHTITEEDRLGVQPRPRIGHGGQVIAHHAHGSIDSRSYHARGATTRECFYAYGDGVNYLPDGMPCFPDMKRAAVFKTVMASIRESRRPWTENEATETARRLLKEAGLELYSKPGKDHR